MAVYQYCTSCGVDRISSCQNQNSHKALKLHRWRADYRLGGADGKRLRKGGFEKKAEAEEYERNQMSDFDRNKMFPHKLLSKQSFNQLADEWYNSYARVYVKSYKAEISHLNMGKEILGEKLVQLMTYSDGEDFIRKRLDVGRTPGAINRDLATIHSVLNWGVKKGYLLKNPFKGLRDLPGEEARVRWLTPNEFEKLVASCLKVDGERLVKVALFGVLSGFRKGNLERVVAQHINDGKLAAIKTKSGKPYDVPISKRLQTLLDELVAANPASPLLYTMNLDRRFREAVKDAGFYIKKRDPNNVTLHVLRHTFAAWYLKKGGDLYKLSKMLGHSSIRVTEKHYAHLCPDDMMKQADLLDFQI